MLELRSVTKTFSHGEHQRVILNACSFTFKAGTAYALMGPSGIGKSTILHLLAGFETPTSGSVLYNDQNIVTMMNERPSDYEYFLLNDIALVFQSPCLIPELSLLENIGLKGLAGGLPMPEIMGRAQQLAKQVGLAGCEQQLVVTLSGGQQQRVAFARALFGNPRFLLLDEPTAHIDKQTAHDILILLQDIKARGTGIIMATHDCAIAHAMDTLITLEQGALHVRA